MLRRPELPNRLLSELSANLVISEVPFHPDGSHVPVIRLRPAFAARLSVGRFRPLRTLEMALSGVSAEPEENYPWLVRRIQESRPPSAVLGYAHRLGTVLSAGDGVWRTNQPEQWHRYWMARRWVKSEYPAAKRHFITELLRVWRVQGPYGYAEIPGLNTTSLYMFYRMYTQSDPHRTTGNQSAYRRPPQTESTAVYNRWRRRQKLWGALTGLIPGL